MPEEELKTFSSEEETKVAEEPKNEEVRLKLEDLKSGYIVGLTKEGELVFELFGSDKGLVDILGLHQYAGVRVSVVTDLNQGLVGTMVKDLMKAVGALTQQVARLTETQKRPSNKL